MKIIKKFIQFKKGFVILYALVVASVLLMLTIGITNINIREYQLSQYGNESLSSYYAAESGLECALYWDLKEEKSAFRYDTTEPTGRDIYCMGETYRVGDDSVNSVYTLNIDLSSSGVGANVEVIVDKTGGKTDIVSRGYNTSDLDSKYVVERGLKVGYGDDVDEGDECEAFDVILVLDSSGSIGDTSDGPANLKLAAKTTIAVNELGEDKFKFAVVDFDSNSTLLTGFTMDVDLLETKIDELNAAGGTNIGKGLNIAKEEFNSSRNRDDAHDIIVLITDGQTSNANSSLIIADGLKSDGVHIIAIGVGGSIQPDYLDEIDSNNDYIAVDDLSALSELANSFTCAFFMRSIGELEREEF
ncbi:MAG: VWA domain-containing protein [Candidatus Pacebacteria bacterium]|nr:VWA domain-containing protein [Candidatus Paceibacterota bacterium]